jgi:ABC-type glycerol-3-phosphate transport system permease component
MTPAPVRPPAVQVFGILNLVFAGLGLLGGVMTYVMYFSGIHLPGPRNAAIEAAQASPTYMSFLRVSFGFGLAATLVLAIAGYGLLRMKTWARKLTIGYAIYGLIAAVAGFIMMQRYLMGPMMHSSDPAAKGGAMGGVVGGLFGLAYPVLLIIFMNKRDIREAFEKNR